MDLYYSINGQLFETLKGLYLINQFSVNQTCPFDYEGSFYTVAGIYVKKLP